MSRLLRKSVESNLKPNVNHKPISNYPKAKPNMNPWRNKLEAIVHTFYPAIVDFFESEEGKREYEEWKAKREERKEKKTTAEQSA